MAATARGRTKFSHVSPILLIQKINSYTIGSIIVDSLDSVTPMSTSPHGKLNNEADHVS